MNLTIRLATTDDAALIADLSRETFYNTFAAQNKPEDMDKFMNEQFTRTALMEEVGKEGSLFLLAYIESEMAGYVRLREESNELLGTKNALEIARLYAANNMVGKGIGKALMQACIDVAKEKKKELLWLGVWEKNDHAIEFYKKWGFEKFGEHDFILGTDVQRDWLMKKRL